MILRNGIPFNVNQSFVADDIQYPPYWYINATQQERDNLGFTEVPDPVLPNLNYYYQNSNNTYNEKPLLVCKDYVKTVLAATRWDRESQGIVYNNLVFPTDPVSKINYLGAMQKSLLDPNYTVLWKARTETDPGSAVFISLSANEMITITNYAISYVTDCFTNESNIALQIDNCTTLSELTAINLDTNWPTRNYGSN